MIRLLNIEDNPGDARLLSELIAGIDYEGAVDIHELVTVPTLSEAWQVLKSSTFDLVLLDLTLPDSAGLDTVRKVQKAVPFLPIVVMSGIKDDLLGVQAVQAGAQDYLVKGNVDSQSLARSIRYALERMQSQIALQEERNRAKEAEQALLISQHYLITAQRLAHVGYLEMNFILNILICSDEASQILGLDSNAKNRSLEDLWLVIHPDDLLDLQEQWKHAIVQQDKYFDARCRVVLQNGSICFTHMQGGFEYDSEGNPVRMLGAIQDISDYISAQQKLQAALDDKLVLLREVHHRVKNNLQAIISLIEMRVDHLVDPHTIQFLREIQEQARTMSLVYEQLYQSENLARVEMQSYLDKLARNVLHAFGEGRRIDISIQALEVWLDVGSATPCGLIVNELVTNALKHAFPPEFAGIPKIQISFFNLERQFKLVVEDNGIGLPDNIELRQTRSMGLRLVKLWAKHQLGGEITIETSDGSKFIIWFDEAHRIIKN